MVYFLEEYSAMFDETFKAHCCYFGVLIKGMSDKLLIRDYVKALKQVVGIKEKLMCESFFIQ